MVESARPDAAIDRRNQVLVELLQPEWEYWLGQETLPEFRMFPEPEGDPVPKAVIFKHQRPLRGERIKLGEEVHNGGLGRCWALETGFVWGYLWIFPRIRVLVEPQLLVVSRTKYTTVMADAQRFSNNHWSMAITGANDCMVVVPYNHNPWNGLFTLSRPSRSRDTNE